MVTTLLDDLSNQVKTKTIFVVHEHFIGHLFVDMKIFSLEIRILHIYKAGCCEIDTFQDLNLRLHIQTNIQI